MQTGTDHIAISVREYEKENLSLGRANKSDRMLNEFRYKVWSFQIKK